MGLAGHGKQEAAVFRVPHSQVTDLRRFAIGFLVGFSVLGVLAYGLSNPQDGSLFTGSVAIGAFFGVLGWLAAWGYSRARVSIGPASIELVWFWWPRIVPVDKAVQFAVIASGRQNQHIVLYRTSGRRLRTLGREQSVADEMNDALEQFR